MTDEAKYCKRCWNTLRFLGTDLMMHCSYCGDQITVSEEGGVSFKKVYRCKPNTFAGNVRPRLVSNDHMSAGATIDEVCPSCGAKELSFKTAQLRSADEGQAVFYHCPKCGYRDTLNT